MPIVIVKEADSVINMIDYCMEPVSLGSMRWNMTMSLQAAEPRSSYYSSSLDLVLALMLGFNDGLRDDPISRE